MHRYCNFNSLESRILPPCLSELSPDVEHEFWTWATEEIERLNATQTYQIYNPSAYVYRNAADWYRRWQRRTPQSSSSTTSKPVLDENDSMYRAIAEAFDKLDANLPEEEIEKVIKQGLDYLRSKGKTYVNYIEYRKERGILQQNSPVQPWDTGHPLYSLTQR